MVGRSHGSHARGTRRRRGCVLLVCASFILAPLWWQRRGDDGEGTRHQTGDSSLLTDLHVPSVGGGYDGSHQGGAANFVDERDIAKSPERGSRTDRGPTPSTKPATGKSATDTDTDTIITTTHDHDHDESSHDHGVPVALAGRPPRDASPTKQKLAELGVIDGWDLDPDTSQTQSSKAITPTRIPFPLGSTTLLPDATDDGHDTHGAGVHLDAYRLNARYLTRVLDPKKLLANFRVVARLPPETTARRYGNHRPLLRQSVGSELHRAPRRVLGGSRLRAQGALRGSLPQRAGVRGVGRRRRHDERRRR